MNDLTNNAGFGLATAVWLAHDEYDNGADEFPGKNVVSVTSLLKSTRQFILSNRIPPAESKADVADMVATTFGHAIHDSIERAWTIGADKALERLGFPPGMRKKVKINPETVEDGDIPVYLEQRGFREITVEGYEFVISGKFDQVINGEVNDTKTTSVYSYLMGSKDEDYSFQGSCYRWLKPERVTSDIMVINFIFTDWQRSMTKSNPKYPAHRVHPHNVNLMPLPEIETKIRAKLTDIIRHQHLPEADLPRCTDKELWKTDPVYKYYSDPAKANAGGRATKNFDNQAEALRYRDTKGKGVVVTIPGKVKACGYCPAFDICSQKDEYEHD